MSAADHVRVVTFNTAAGNPRILTPQAAFLGLPFYRDALEGSPEAPILALQEVGPPQWLALGQAAARPGARFALLEWHRPGLVWPMHPMFVAHARAEQMLANMDSIVEEFLTQSGRP